MEEASSTSDTKKRILTLHQRLKIIQELKDGVPVDILAKEYEVKPLTIRRIKRNEQRLYQRSQMWGDDIQRRLRKPILVDLDARLYAWYMEERMRGRRVTETILQRKATELNREHGGPSSFVASRAWTWRFKVRHNIPSGRVSGDVANAREADSFTHNLRFQLAEENIPLYNVYNMDEVSLMWKALPQKVCGGATETIAPDSKVQEDRVTVAFCANATGTHKLPALVIYRYGRPMALKHCWDQIPVIFMAQKNSRMDRSDIIH